MQESRHGSDVYPDSSPQLDGAELSLKYQSHKNTFGTLSTCLVCWLTNPGWWWDGEAIGLQLPSLTQQTVLDQAASWVQEIEANSLDLRRFQKQVIWEKADRSSRYSWGHGDGLEHWARAKGLAEGHTLVHTYTYIKSKCLPVVSVILESSEDSERGLGLGFGPHASLLPQASGKRGISGPFTMGWTADVNGDHIPMSATWKQEPVCWKKRSEILDGKKKAGIQTHYSCARPW